MNNLFSIISHFNTKGTIQEIKPLGTGLINDTYKVTTLEQDAPDYVSKCRDASVEYPVRNPPYPKEVGRKGGKGY